MDLESFFSKDHVVLLKSSEKQLIIKELIEKLEDLGRIENADRYYAQVVHRESLENTGVGSGFAIPHARTDSVRDFISIFGISGTGVDYQAYDNKPVNYFMLSIFPTEMSTKYLYLIGMMARIFSNPEKKEAIDEAKTPAKIYTVLKKESKSYFELISKKSQPQGGKIENLSGVPSSDLDLLIRLDRLFFLFDGGDKSESITKKIEEIKTLIDHRSLKYYDRMRTKCRYPFAIIEKGNCSGCHMDIPPVYLAEIKDTKGISVCNHCGRFLIVL
jgi:mannitol/fructose-specific phosphotransferase system IIA component (Ntr-type)